VPCTPASAPRSTFVAAPARRLGCFRLAYGCGTMGRLGACWLLFEFGSLGTDLAWCGGQAGFRGPFGWAHVRGSGSCLSLGRLANWRS
jgi:hypothetical protein